MKSIFNLPNFRNHIIIFNTVLFLLGLIQKTFPQYSSIELKEFYDKRSDWFINDSKMSTTPFNEWLNDSYIDAWQSELDMFRATKDKQYLIRFMKIAITVIRVRRDITPISCGSSGNFKYWYDKCFVAFEPCNSATAYVPKCPSTCPFSDNVDCFYYNGQILAALSEFLYIVKVEDLYNISTESLIDVETNNSILYPNYFNNNWSTYLSFANWLLAYVVESADAILQSNRYFTYNGSTEFYDPVTQNNIYKPYGINKVGALATAYFLLGEITGSTVYQNVNQTMLSRYLGNQHRYTGTNSGGHCSSYLDSLPVFEIRSPYNSLKWGYMGWRPVCGGSQINVSDDYEDISHAVWTLQYILLIDKYKPTLLSSSFMERLHNTVTQNIVSQYLPNGCSTIHAAVDGDDWIAYNPGYSGLNSPQALSFIALMPLYKYDYYTNASGNVFNITMDFLKNSCIDPSINYNGIRHLGLSRSTLAQWNMVCPGLRMFRRNLVYNQDFIVKGLIVLSPNDVSNANYLNSSYADPYIAQSKFVVSSNVNANFTSGKNIKIKDGVHLKYGSKVKLSINPSLCNSSRSANSNGSLSELDLREVESLNDHVKVTNLDSTEWKNIDETGNCSISFYPNPSNDYVNLFSKCDTSYSVIIYDDSGSVVKKFAMSQFYKLDVRDLSKGLYFALLSSVTSSYCFKFIKM